MLQIRSPVSVPGVSSPGMLPCATLMEHGISGDGTTATGSNVASGTRIVSASGKTYTVTLDGEQTLREHDRTEGGDNVRSGIASGISILVTSPCRCMERRGLGMTEAPALQRESSRCSVSLTGSRYTRSKSTSPGTNHSSRPLLAKGGDFVCVEANLVLAGSQQASTTTPTTAVTTASTYDSYR